MQPYAYPTPVRQGPWSWPGRAEAWLDARGRMAWVLATLAALIVFWPVGLALLAYVLWSRKMSCTSRRMKHQGHEGRGLEGRGHEGWGRWGRSWDRPSVFQTSGNAAFDAYRDQTLRRLEEEQAAFAAFLQRLRDAKDKQEFDAFMEDRARAAREGRDVTPPAGDEAPRDPA